MPDTPLAIRMILQKYPPELGGAERQAARLGEQLNHLGHSVQVLTIAWQPPGGNRRDEAGLLVRALVGRPSSRKLLRFALETAGILLLERNQYDVAHFHLLASHALVGGLAARLARRGVIVKLGASGTYGEVGMHRGRWSGRLRLTLLRRLAHRVVVTNEEMRAELIEVGFKPEHIALIPNGIDCHRICPATPEERTRLRAALNVDTEQCSGRLVVYTGRLEPQKAVPTLLDAFARVRIRVPDAILVLVGEGSERNALQAQIQHLGLGPAVRMVGALPNTEVLTILQAADVYVLASRAEGISNALLEAMASALPCVVSDIPGNRDLVTSGVDGLCVPPEDVAGLEDALVQLLTDASLARRLGAAARARVMEGYALETTARRYLELYRALPGRQRRNHPE